MPPRTALAQLAQRASRTLSPRLSSRSSIIAHPLLTTQTVRISLSSSSIAYNQSNRSLSTSRAFHKGLSPETENPQPKEPESNDTASSTSKVELSADRYHELSDSYLNTLVDKLEELQEAREDVDVEYSSGVLNLKFPPHGQYVLNKQPPNKQIWLSSPITGPKRFDFVIASEGQDAKEGTGAGDWVFLRDGSALSDILLKEVGVDMKEAWTPEEETSK